MPKVNTSSPAFIQTSADAKRAMRDVEKRLKQQLDKVGVFAEAGLMEVGKRIYDRSQTLVPVDTGKLKKSGYVEKRKTDDGSKMVAVGYAKDNDPPYAVYVHELGNKHAPPTQWKFLQTAGNEVAQDVASIVAEAIKKGLK